jgi:hypothetical protein
MTINMGGESFSVAQKKSTRMIDDKNQPSPDPAWES